MDIKDNYGRPIPNDAPMKVWHKYMCDGIGGIGRKGRRFDHELGRPGPSRGPVVSLYTS